MGKQKRFALEARLWIASHLIFWRTKVTKTINNEIRFWNSHFSAIGRISIVWKASFFHHLKGEILSNNSR